MYGLSPDLQWIQFSTGKGSWSLEAEESFSRRLKLLAQCARDKAFNSYNFKGDFQLSPKQYKSFKDKVLGINKPKVKVTKFNGTFND